MNSANSWLKRLFVGALLAGLVAQVFVLVNAHGGRTIEIYKAIGQTGSWRGANFAFSQEAANFYNFLRAQIPQDTRVLIPTRSDGPEAFTRNGNVEFFLWPRKVGFCEGTAEECVIEAANQNSAILVTDVPGFSVTPNASERVHLFNSQWGVYLPNQTANGNLQSPYRSLWEIARSILLPAVLLAALSLPGTWLARKTLPKEHGLMHLTLGIGSGLGWLSLSLFISLWAGATLSNLLIVGLVIFYWGAAAILYVFLRPKRRPIPSSRKLSREDVLIIIAIAIPIAWAFLLAIGNAYSHTDEIVLWGAKGYGIPAVGLQAGVNERGTLTTWYPLNIPLLISTFLTLFGERLPESKLIFPCYMLGFVGMLYAFFRKRIEAVPSLIGSLLIITIPTVFLMGTMAHANLPFTFYLVGGILLLYCAQIEGQTYSIHYWIWGVVFLILAAWTRPEGLYLAWVTAATAAVVFRPDRLKETKRWFWLVAGLALYSIFWILAAPSVYLKPGFTDGVFGRALDQVLQGNLHFKEAGFIFQSLALKTLSVSEWGILGWSLILFAVLFIGMTRSGNSNFFLAETGLVIILFIFGAFVANSYLPSETRDIDWWVNTSLLRLVFPGLVLIWIQFYGDLAGRIFPAHPA